MKKIGIILFLFVFCGCVQKQRPEESHLKLESVPEAHHSTHLAGNRVQPGDMQLKQKEPDNLERELATIIQGPGVQGRSTSECYSLRPAASQTNKKKRGRCEPQSLPFARCRSGISSCCLGWNNGPLTWFACEKQRGNTSSVPVSGSVLILDAVKRHKMPTGHVAYVEKVLAEDDSHYQIIFTHTNYDRKCSLETNIKASYNLTAKTLDIHSGAWKDWGKGLPVAGFILR